MFGASKYIVSTLLTGVVSVGLIGTLHVTIGMLSSNVLAQVKKVPTERIIVPEEKSEDSAPADTDNATDEDDTGESVEIPTDALPSLELKNKSETDQPEDTAADTPEEDGPPPPILRDVAKLPEPVRKMHARILEVAKRGKIEDLRPLLETGAEATTLSIGGLEGDPIGFMKETSGDDDGYEILAILIEVLEAGFVHLDNGTDEEVYVWPYFFSHALDKLKPEQKVELFRILTAGDVQDSENFGSYVFYRAGIKPDGTWAFFVAGD